MATNTPAYLIAEFATAVAISKGSSNEDKLARAKTAASIGAFFSAVGAANFTEITAQVQTAIANIKDAALAQFATNLWSLGQPVLQVQLNVNAAIPVIGGSLEAWASDTGSGISAAAGAAITQYSAPAAK